MNPDPVSHRVAHPLTRSLLAAAGTALLLACGSTSDRADRPAPAELPRESVVPPVAIDSTPAAPDSADIRFEVNLAQRTLFVLGAAGDTVARHRLAVGSAEWPTRTGQWAIQQVVLNPSWTPPDESWAEEREPRASGDPANPLGVAQLVYDLPRTIHGTSNPASIGTATSHGSLRVANADALALSRLVMERTGITDVDGRLTRAASTRTEKQVIDVPKVVPIRVY